MAGEGYNFIIRYETFTSETVEEKACVAETSETNSYTFTTEDLPLLTSSKGDFLGWRYKGKYVQVGEVVTIPEENYILELRASWTEEYLYVNKLDLIKIADAVREKTHTEEEMTIVEVPTKIKEFNFNIPTCTLEINGKADHVTVIATVYEDEAFNIKKESFEMGGFVENVLSGSAVTVIHNGVTEAADFVKSSGVELIATTSVNSSIDSMSTTIRITAGNNQDANLYMHSTVNEVV